MVEPNFNSQFRYFFHNFVDEAVQRVLENTTAHIKCDATTKLPNDQVLLVVWYKKDSPIYR